MDTDSAGSLEMETNSVVDSADIDSSTIDNDVSVIELNAVEEPQDEEEAAKQAALDAIDRKEKTPNEDKILAQMDAELATYLKNNENRRFISLDPELIASTEEYIKEMKEAAAKRPKVKLEEDTRKFERNAGNDPSYVNMPVYDPDDAKYRDIAATIKRHIEAAEQQKKLKIKPLPN